MIVYKCLVNGHLAPAARLAVEEGLRRINAERLGLSAQSLRIEFTELAPGLGYTAGQPPRPPVG